MLEGASIAFFASVALADMKAKGDQPRIASSKVAREGTIVGAAAVESRAAAWVQKMPPSTIDRRVLFDFRTLQVIRLRHVSKALTCRYPSSLLWEIRTKSLSERERYRAAPLPGCCP